MLGPDLQSRDDPEPEPPGKMEVFKESAPSDAACAKAWEKIAGIATAHCLIAQAYGGVMTLAMPEEQRRAGIRRRTLEAHMRNENGVTRFASL